MTTHETRKVQRVTEDADKRIRAYAREKGITAFDAASMWQPPAEPREEAESSAPDMLADPRVLKFAAARKLSPASALSDMLDMAIRRIESVAAHTAKLRAAK